MKRLFLILTCLLFVACAPPDDNHGYGYEYDEIDNDTGLRIRNFKTLGDTAPTLKDVAAQYLAITNCAGFSKVTPGALVIIVDEILYDENGYRVYGRYYYEGATALISTLDNDCIICVINHELMHHLSAINDASNDHSAPQFSYCI
ncbi:MAG: hypothetical protein OEW37_05120 [Rhodospirillaceae bacterium]|nr:hypothetical protein [Rhodospirillaceae bacterium]